MSRSDARCRSAAILPIGLALLAMGLAQAADQDAAAPKADVQQSAYRSSIAQESVRKQADKIQADLIQLVRELKLNGLENANLALLSQASTNLSGLSQDEMQQVINALQNASITPDESKQQQSLVSAYQGQQDLVLKLKQLAAALASQQAGDRLVTQLKNLIARQSGNIRQTSTLQTGGHALDQFDSQEKSLHGLVSAEQTSIGGEIDLLATGLATQAAQPSPDAASETAKAVLNAMNGTLLKDTAPLATQLTKAGPFPDAVSKQTAVRQYLTVLLQAAVSNADAATRLQQAKNQLDQVAADQKDLTDVAKQSKLDPATLAERQAEINDRTEVAKTLLAPLNPDAAKQVDAAQQDMKQSADALSDPKKTADAIPKQEAATQALADAAKLLDQQIASVQDQQNESPTDQMAQLQKVQDEIKQAQVASPQDAAKDLQQAQMDALAQSPDAAAKLADAADQMQQPQPNTAAANQDLTQANDDIQKQKDALAQAAQDYQALAQASQQLDQAQKLASAADQSLKSNTDNNLAEPARQLTGAQDQLAQVSQNPPKNLPANAQQSLQKAADALKNGSIQAVQANRSGADEQTQQGLAALKQTQDALAQAMAQIQAQSRQQMRTNRGQNQQDTAQNGFNRNRADLNGSGAYHDDRFITGGATGSVERGSAQVVGKLSPKDRDAITQFQAEKTPPEYAPLVQQYLKNLADTSETH